MTIGDMYSGFAGNNAFNARTFKFNFPKVGKTNDREIAEYLNNYDYMMHLNIASQIITSRFKWGGSALKNFPPGYIERLLFANGFCVAFDDKDYGFMILAATITGYNYMNNPIKFTVQGNGFSRTLDIDECVIIRDNYGMIAPFLSTARYCEIIADIGRTVEIYQKGMKKPTVIPTTEKQRLTAESQAKNILANEPYILMEFADKELEGFEPPKPFNTPHNASDLNGLMMAKRTLYAEMLSMCGININTVAKGGAYRSDMEKVGENTQTEILLQNSWDCRVEAQKALEEMVEGEITCDNNLENIVIDPSQYGNPPVKSDPNE